ncbi:glucose 1-dehydrogenase [uncultured Albimonas sp.]|uniref:SDR family NAD(P)-dependent oxidoreductase n=1 Tax=uncultured Albimonas sp. TaxID=1331701 RepID=UPI0030EBDF4B|tara:strand:+ start:2985 stop:3734 length:750 start_codon:yes stop_codon:yes gene_type:complete
MSGLLEGRAVLVIGGASGIGRATALGILREGGRVVIADLEAEAARALASACGDRAVGIGVDVARREQVEAAADLILARHGRFDGMVNCAARPEPYRGLLEAPEEACDEIFAPNVRGAWIALRVAIARMQAQGRGGSIVTIASAAGVRGVRGMALYCASKHAVIGLTRSAALEFARQGPRINAVCPGVIETPMMAGVAEDPRARRSLEAGQPNGRFGAPEEVAEACLWLLSDRASLVTGAVLGVDGGMTA